MLGSMRGSQNCVQGFDGMMAPSALARTAVNRRTFMAGIFSSPENRHHDHVNVEVDEFGRQHGDP
jgi:hypothetical protein